MTSQHHPPGGKSNNRGDDSEEEYDFDYSDDEEEETDVDLENRYYSAKAIKTEDPRAAVEAFREVHGPSSLHTTLRCTKCDGQSLCAVTSTQSSGIIILVIAIIAKQRSFIVLCPGAVVRYLEP